MKGENETVKIAIVDDETSYRQKVKESLGKSNIAISIYEYNSAEEFWRSREINDMDILLLDVSMPHMNGIDLLDLISEKNLKMKTVMLTNLASEDTIIKALKKGAIGYIWKSEIGFLEQAVQIVIDGGAMISPTIAVKLMKTFTKKTGEGPDYPEKLTPREKQILEILSTGESCDRVAGIMNLSTHTVRTHIRNIYEKLHVNNRIGMLKKAGELGII